MNDRCGDDTGCFSLAAKSTDMRKVGLRQCRDEFSVLRGVV